MEKDHRPDVPASTVTDLTANRQYKDTVFRMLFSDKEALLSLFNAVTGRNYTHAEDLKIVTLKNAIYMGMKNDPDLELKVTVFNINEGQNREMMEKCRLLKDYASYVARVRRYAAVMDLTDAVRRAVTECIQEGVLADFLQRNREEVEMVSILEYDKELEEKKLRKSEYEAGLADGERLGMTKGITEGTRLGQAKELVQLCLEFGLDTDSILRKLQEHLAISEEEARLFFEKFR